MENCKKITINISLRIMSIIISAIISFCFIFLSAVASGYYYDMSHNITNPVERGDDLGAGLFVVHWATVAFLWSIPLFFFLYKIILKKIIRKFGWLCVLWWKFLIFWPDC